jgi:ectoine hydroxylase-related dioxygenase (phytanoyl-CoA dioxygenase family)
MDNMDYLLDDDEMLAFIARGYHIVQCSHGQGNAPVHEAVCAEADVYYQGRASFAKHGRIQSMQSDASVAYFNDLMKSIPALRNVRDDMRVRGALESILGPRYRFQAHRHCHYVVPKQKGQLMHQDGHWRSFGGWTRHYRRWHLPRKLICFYYPHDVQAGNAPTQVLAGSQYFQDLSPELKAKLEVVSLEVPAGSFVILHHNLFHGATDENDGLRRIMIKLHCDRTDEPSSADGPSWRHTHVPLSLSSEQNMQPWLLYVWNWLAGSAEGSSTDISLDDSEASCFIEVLQAAGRIPPTDGDAAADPAHPHQLALRAAYMLGCFADPSWVRVLLGMLRVLCTQHDSFKRIIDPRLSERAAYIEAEPFISCALAAFGPRAAKEVCAALDEHTDGGCSCSAGRESLVGEEHYRALLVDVLVDCGGGDEVIGCFVDSLHSKDGWVRHNAIQGLEHSASRVEHTIRAEAIDVVTPLQRALSDPHPFVVFGAISALQHVRGSRSSGDTSGDIVLAGLVAPLEATHPNPLVRWKAREATAEARRTQSSL